MNQLFDSAALASESHQGIWGMAQPAAAPAAPRPRRPGTKIWSVVGESSVNDG